MENKAKLKYTIGLILFGLVIIVFIFYYAGFRITDNFKIGKIGQLEINLPFEETVIIINKKTKIISEKNLETIKLSPKTYEIIISKEGYYPWIKKVTIPSNKKISIDPFFVNQNPSGQMITTLDPDYWKIKNLVEKTKLPNKENPLTSSEENILIWVENNSIIAKTENSLSTVISPDTVIKNVSFYKNRYDVIIFSTHIGVYAIEINTEEPQNFMPIYKGVNPYFATSTENSIYVLDNESLMEVVI